MDTKRKVMKLSQVVELTESIYADIPVQEVKAEGLTWKQIMALLD